MRNRQKNWKIKSFKNFNRRIKFSRIRSRHEIFSSLPLTSPFLIFFLSMHSNSSHIKTHHVQPLKCVKKKRTSEKLINYNANEIIHHEYGWVGWNLQRRILIIKDSLEEWARNNIFTAAAKRRTPKTKLFIFILLQVWESQRRILYWRP